MKFPVVQELAAEGFPVQLTRGVLSFSQRAFSQWRGEALSAHDHEDAHVAKVVHEFTARFWPGTVDDSRSQRFQDAAGMAVHRVSPGRV